MMSAPEFDPALVDAVARTLWESGCDDGAAWRETYARAVLTVVAPVFYEEIMTDALHPEFGTEWREPDGVIWKAAQQARAEGRKQAAEAKVPYDDERTEDDAAGDYMVIRFGGDTGREEDWAEAYRVARLTKRPAQDAYQRGMVEGANRVRAAVEAEEERQKARFGHSVPGFVTAAREAVVRIEGGA